MFNFQNWGIEKALLKNIIVGFIMLLLAQMSAVAMYFRSELDKAQGRYEAMENEYRQCMEDASRKLEELKNEHIAAIEEAHQRQDELERRLQKTTRKR